MATDSVVVKEGAAEGIEFYGKHEINKHGRPASEAPAWTFPQHKEKLEEDIAYTKSRLDRGEIPEKNRPEAMAELAKMKDKLDKINESTPKFSGAQKDVLKKVSEGLGEKIASSMPSRTEMMKGLVDAHEEARRMADPCIELRGEEAVLARKAGCRIDDKGRVSRTDAERLWKFCNRGLGNPSNTERLRRG